MRIRALAVGIAIAGSLLLLAVLAAPQAPESSTRLTVYTTQSAHTLTLVERSGQLYCSVGDLLDPLGEMKVEDNGRKWRARFNGIELRFEDGKTKAKIRGKDFDLGGKFAVESGRGLVPITSLTPLLSALLSTHVVFHETARRLFLGDPATEVVAEAPHPGVLALNFSAAVNPTISAEGNRLRLRFNREPLMAAPAHATLDDKTISFSEQNGAAELTINASAPLLATYSNGGRTITLAPAPVAQKPPPAEVAPQPAAPAPAAVASEPAPATPAATRERVAVLLDPAHGGDERGAALSDRLAEKDVTLAFARRLRAELAARGVSAALLRESDALIGADQRAADSNAMRPALYVALHAASSGPLVRVYTALLPAGNATEPLVPWERAQQNALGASRATADAVAVALARRQIAAPVLAAPLRPLNNITGAAIALEIAPAANAKGGADSLASPAYQQQMAVSLAVAIASALEERNKVAP